MKIKLCNYGVELRFIENAIYKIKIISVLIID
jgi:hypothetical protein